MEAATPLIRVGTRGSPLALVQARETRDRLAAAHEELAGPGAIEIVVIKTTGDRIQDRALLEIGGKGLFTKEIEEALLDGRIDIAVHSMKDVPTRLPEGLGIAAILKREDPRDAWISRQGHGLMDLPAGALVGTASLRRQAQVRHLRPDLRVATLRGNVETRLAKLERGEVDATLLALAGLRRLGRAEVATAVLDPALMLPAVAQGAIGLEARLDDDKICGWLAALNDDETAAQSAAERALLAGLDGSCRTPIAAYARPEKDARLALNALVALPDGSEVHQDFRAGPTAEAEALGRAAAEALRAAAGPAFFAKLSGGI